MQKNMGVTDKTVRLIAGVALVVLYLTGIVEGTLGVIALVVAGVFVLTSLVSFCPLYPILGINTCAKKKVT